MTPRIQKYEPYVAEIITEGESIQGLPESKVGFVEETGDTES